VRRLVRQRARAQDRGMSETIVPRWEWRTFAAAFGTVDHRFAALQPESVRETDEVYVLSRLSDSSVKLREQVIDVKVLREVSADGLERWEPVLKAPTARPAEDFSALADALGVDVRSIRVHKRRAHYLLDGCMAERSQIATEHGTRETIGIESEDPDLVRATVAGLGFALAGNVNLPRELKLLSGLVANWRA
jgi:exopolyphosphatase/guanosine-5'-triphosphate,3'-diphosphate pyrophosphatase